MIGEKSAAIGGVSHVLLGVTEPLPLPDRRAVILTLRPAEGSLKA